MKSLNSIINNKKSIIAKGILLGAFLFGNTEKSKAQFERIDYVLEINSLEKDTTISIGGYKKTEDAGFWSGFNYEKGKELMLMTHIDKIKTRTEVIQINLDNTLNYVVGYTNHSVETNEIYDDVEKTYQKDNGTKSDFSFEHQERIKQLMNMNCSCSEKWTDFLKQEISNLTNENKEMKYFAISYRQIDNTKFPREKLIICSASDRTDISLIDYQDTDNDSKYDFVVLKNMVNEEEKLIEGYRINHANGTISYWTNYPKEIAITDGKKEDFSPQLQDRIKRIMNLNIDCSGNEAIPFLYEEYAKWSSE